MDQHAVDIRRAMIEFDKHDSLRMEIWLDSLDQLAAAPLWLQWFTLSAHNDHAFTQRDFSTALFYANQIGNFLAQFDAPPDRLADVYFRKGDALFQMRQYDLALESFLKGKELGDEAKDECVLASFNYRLGMVSYRQSNMRDAVGFWMTALRNFDHCDEFKGSGIFRIQEIASNIGLAYWKRNDYAQSILWYDSALTYVRALPMGTQADSVRVALAEAVIKGNQGCSYYEMGQKEKGFNMMKASFDFNFYDKHGDQGHATFIGNQLVDYLLQEDRLAEASAYLNQLQQRMSIIRKTPQELRLAHNRLNYYIKTAQTDSVAKYFARYSAVSDSLKNNDRALNKLNTSLLLSGMEKDYQIQAVQQSAKAQRDVNRITLFFLIVVSISGCVVIYLLTKARKQNRLLRMLNEFVNQQNKQLEEAKLEQNKTNQALAASNAKKEELLRVVAHDLRNPLAAIYSMSQMVLEHENPNDREFFELTQKACVGALQLINDLLEGGTEKMRLVTPQGFSEQEINSFLQDTLKLVAYRAEEKEIKLNLEPTAQSLVVSIDTERFRRALINLLVNAIKFSPRGSEVDMQARLKGGRLVIKVLDKGIGLSDDVKRQLLVEGGASIRSRGTEGEQSFGMGLSITKSIADLHGAELEVESEPGMGSVFSIILPAKRIVKTSQ